MPPKTEKRKSLQEEKKAAAAALNGPINTDEWKCAVTFVVEGSENDFELTKKFAEEASNGARIQVKCIDFDLDVMRILKQFAAENLDYNLAYLQNFLPTFQKAAAFVSDSEPIPVELLAQVVKAILLMLKKNDMDSPALRTCEGDPIEVMMSSSLVPETAVGNVEKTNTKANNDKKKQQKSSEPNIVPGFKVKPLPGGKDTKLVRRGEKPKVLRLIDDAPQNSVYDIYVALTGFRYANLPLEMIKVDVPLLGVICINSSKLPCNDRELNDFWNDFRQSIGDPGLTSFYQNVVFQLFVPPDLPKEEKELKNLIYAEVCYLMYDLSDLHLQHTRYLSEMQLFNVEEGTEKLVPEQKIARELDEVPYECLTIPVILQHILDMICGDDGEDHPGEEESKEEYTEALEITKHLSFSAPSTFFYSSMYDITYSDSNPSLIPFTSTVKLPQTRFRSFLKKEERLLYDKIMNLEKMYGIEGAADVFSDGSRSTHQSCRAARKRLPCANLDFEIKNHGKAILTKFWMNYPEKTDEDYVRGSEIMSTSQFPEFMVDYLLYLLWIDEKEWSIAETPERRSSASETPNAKFTITDGSRIALQKTYREDYFSPQQLKIVSQEMLLFLPEPPPQCPALGESCSTSSSSSSGSCSSTKYLIPVNDYDDLWKFMDEKTPACMKGYDFVEELSANEMISRIEKAALVYDSVSHVHFLPSDSIYLVLSNRPSLNGVRRDVYNAMLVTPVGLRDFHSYVLDERESKRFQQSSADTGGGLQCPNTLYNPTPDFRDFTDQDFWIENSIKYSRGAEGVEAKSGEPDDQLISGTETAKTESPRHAQPNGDATLIGFNFEGDAVQFSGIETTYTGPEVCRVRVCLQERLYGKQQLGLHIQQGGHSLHLYSFVCPKPYVERPYTFHAEYQNGIIVAFSERLKFPGLNPGGGASGTRLNEPYFAYDMKLSYPNGLIVETVMKHIDTGYIKQRYLTKRNDSSEAVREENSRLFLPNGNIVRMLTENVAQILMPDTSIITFSLDDFGLQEEYEGEDLDGQFHSYAEIRPDGWRRTVTGDFITNETRLQILKFSDLRDGTKYFQRMDYTYRAAFGDGTACVEFPDGSKVYTYLTEEEVAVAEDDCGGPYVMIHASFVMEHPEFATVVYESERGGWRVILPEKSEIKVDLSGGYQVRIDEQTELEVGVDVIRMSRYGKRREFVMKTEADLTAFFGGSNDYCTTIDSTGRKFTVEVTGECQVTEGEEENWEAPKRYFVVRRDLTGFEILHGSNVSKEISSMDPETASLCEEFSEEAGTRYFAFVNAVPEGEGSWRVESTVPSARKNGKREADSKPPSTYGTPPSWFHPFPKKKKKVEVPDILKGRVLLEVRPTGFPAPPSGECFFCDVTGLPEISKSNISDLMRRAVVQDQEALKEIYLAVVAQQVKSRRLSRPIGSELQKYLDLREYKAQLREFMKRAIRFKKVVGYFDHAVGVASLIIGQIIEAAVTEETESETVEQRPESSSEFTAASSEVEYNLQWRSEPDYSELSCRSDISPATAPPVVGGVSVCQLPLPRPRAVQSAPITGPDWVYKEQEVKSYNFGDSLSAPASHICTFTETDISVLAEKSPGRAEEGRATYDLDDLMRLGLV